MNYFKEISKLIEEREVNKRYKEVKDNYDNLKTNWNIGKLLYEAQGGESRAKYGDGLIKKWSVIFVSKYGKSYSAPELRKMRQYFLKFQKCVTLSRISWNHIVAILPLKNESERNYYINEVIINNLSVRRLRDYIKKDTFNRLSYKDKENIELIDDNNYNLTINNRKYKIDLFNQINFFKLLFFLFINFI